MSEKRKVLGDVRNTHGLGPVGRDHDPRCLPEGDKGLGNAGAGAGSGDRGAVRHACIGPEEYAALSPNARAAVDAVRAWADLDEPNTGPTVGQGGTGNPHPDGSYLWSGARMENVGEERLGPGPERATVQAEEGQEEKSGKSRNLRLDEPGDVDLSLVLPVAHRSET